MISVIVCTRDLENSKTHREHTIKSAGSRIEYLLIDNSNNHHSLCSAYNEGAKRATGDILVFMHDDVFPVNNGWADVLENKFKHSESIGAIGVAGTNYLFKDNAAWFAPGRPFVQGKVIHEFKDKNELLITIFSDIKKDEEVVVLDGLFLAIRASLFNKKIKFDEETFNRFHFYDLDICMQIRDSHQIYVTPDILLKHRSSGVFGEEWKTYAKIFLKKHAQNLPATCTELKPDKNNRNPYDSPPLSTLLKPETVDFIKGIGIKSGSDENVFIKAEHLFKSEDFQRAHKLLSDILNKNPEVFKYLHLKGLCEFKLGNYSQALIELQKAEKLDQHNYMLYYNISSILIEISKYNEALQYLNKAIQLKSDFIPALNKIVYLFSIMGQLALAKKTCQTILKVSPQNYECLNNIGNICKDMGNINDALKYYEEAIKIKPDYSEAISNLLLNSHYNSDDPEKIWNLHKKFGTYDSQSLKVDNLSSFKSTGNQKIRVGYLSPDFRTHSVSYFFISIIKNHSKENFEIFCYNDNASHDQMTKEIKNHCSNWRDIYNYSDNKLRKAIESDKLDILIDLAGHSGKNRMAMLKVKVAPIQITYLGYPDTTGLKSIDYRITDAHAETDIAENYYSEQLLKFKNSFLCYSPPINIPPHKNTPALDNNFITFGSFNNFSKISEKTISLWIEILNKIPNSKIMLKNRALNDSTVLNDFSNKLENYGIDKSRLILKSYAPTFYDHLELYNQIDIALDTFPYNGTTTTCEALSMGIPVITLCGKIHASRVGNSILTNSGFNFLVCNSEEEYIAKAVEISANLQSLNNIRKDIQKSFKQSKVCSPNQFVIDYENILLDCIEGRVVK